MSVKLQTTAPTLPIIRRIMARRFTISGWGEQRIFGLYRDCLLLITLRRGALLPSSFYQALPPTGHLAANVSQLERMELNQITKIEISAGRDFIAFTIHYGGALATFRLSKPDGALILQALRELIGERVDSSTPLSELRAVHQRSIGSLIGGVLVLMASLGCLCVWGRTGQWENGEIDWVLLLGAVATFWSVWMLLCHLMDHVINARSRSRANGREPFHSFLFGWMLKLIGLPVFFLGYFFADQIGEFFVPSNYAPVSSALDAVWMGERLGRILGITASLIGVACVYLGYRIGIQPLDRSGSPGKHGIFLRAFSDDGRVSLIPNWLSSKMLGLKPFGRLRRLGPLGHCHPVRVLRLFFGVGMDTTEEQLVRFFGSKMPLVAIGRPGEHLATGGAQRVYVSDDAWQAEVHRFIKEGEFVILQPAPTDSVSWELRTVVEHIEPRRFLLAVGHLAKNPGLNPYARFQERFSALTGKQLPTEIDDAPFIRFDDNWHPVPLPAQYHTPFLWPVLGMAIDLKQTLAPFTERLRGQQPNINLPQGEPSNLSLGAAVCFWTVLTTAACALVSVVAQEFTIHRAKVAGPFQEYSGTSVSWIWPLGRWWHRDAVPKNDGEYVATFSRSDTDRIDAWVVAAKDPANGDSIDHWEAERIQAFGSYCLLPPEIVQKTTREINRRQWRVIELIAVVDDPTFLAKEKEMEWVGRLIGYSRQPTSVEDRIANGLYLRVLIACYTGREGRYAFRLEQGLAHSQDWFPWSSDGLPEVFDALRLPGVTSQK